MNTETERIWGAGIAALLQALKKELICAMFPEKDTIVLSENGFFIRCVKNTDNPNTGSIKIQYHNWNEPFCIHFVSNTEALLYLQSIEVSPAWTKAAKATERAFS